LIDLFFTLFSPVAGKFSKLLSMCLFFSVFNPIFPSYRQIHAVQGEATDSLINLFLTLFFPGAGKFNTLLSLVEKVGLTETLTTGGPFTVFAPTDKAFAELGKKKNLSATPLDQLKKVKKIVSLVWCYLLF
jgi:Fasciclin domain